MGVKGQKAENLFLNDSQYCHQEESLLSKEPVVQHLRNDLLALPA